MVSTGKGLHGELVVVEVEDLQLGELEHDLGEGGEVVGLQLEVPQVLGQEVEFNGEVGQLVLAQVEVLQPLEVVPFRYLGGRGRGGGKEKQDVARSR